jgi:hypothetical protein
MAPGRAELDVVAIDDGLLPKGAYLVSSAGVPEAFKVRRLGMTSGADAASLDLVRLRFSLSLLVRRSEYITEERNAAARSRNPERAARYDRGVAILNGGE